MRKLLTDRFVAAARKPGTVFDTKTRGLALRVGTRTKAWSLVYRNGGTPQWFRLGDYPSLTLAKARERAENERATLNSGVDPAAERRKPAPASPPPAFTFADFVPTFIAFQKGRKKKSWADQERVIKNLLLPVWGPLPLKSITRTQVAEFLDARAGDGLTVGVNRLQALISRIFTVALDRGLIDAHPVARMIRRFPEAARDRVLADDELRALWTALDAQPGTASDAVRLRLLLGQRGGETAGMLWSEVDLDMATWSLERTRTKNGQPHVVALPPTARALLVRRRADVADDEPRVFPGLSLAGDEHRAMGTLHGGAYTWKDLRRTVGTRLADLGFDVTTRGRVLNHAQHTVTEKHYNRHQYVEEIRRALTAWDEELQRILRNAPKEARVLPMRAR